MAENEPTRGRLLRFLASDGMANEDPDVIKELLVRAHRMAYLVVEDNHASAELRAEAQAFLDQLKADAFEKYE
jgi:hypothetical protein